MAWKPSHIKDSLQKLLNQELKSPDLNVEMRIWEFWSKAVGTDVARQAEPKSFKNGVLFVQTKHALWSTELQFRRHQIIQKLNEALGQEIVKDIHFRN